MRRCIYREGTAAKVVAFVDLLAALCGFLGFGAWAGFGLMMRDRAWT